MFGRISVEHIEFTSVNCSAEYRDVVARTKKERELNPNFPDDKYVIADVGNGDTFLQDRSGSVYVHSHESGRDARIANSIQKFILDQVIN